MRKEIKIGFVVVVAMALLFFGFFYLKGQNIFKDQKLYYAIYDNVSGLTENNSVNLNGFKIGSIRSISLLPHTKGKILVSFEISNATVIIPDDSEARIESLDLLGTKAVSIRLGESTELAKVGDTLRSSMETSLQDNVNAQIAPLKEKTEELIGSMDSAVTIVKMILNEDARSNLSASFKSIKRAIGTFETIALRMDTLVADEKNRIDKILVNVESITNNVKRSNEDITSILDNFASISDTLAKANIAQTVLSANEALNEVTQVFEKINRGEGTMGMLIHNDTLYQHVESAARDLDLLLYDMQKHPERYVHISVFGRKNKNGLGLNKDEEKTLINMIKRERINE